MIDIFVEPSPADSSLVRVSDYGMTLMRLSYSYELNTPNKERILARILSENRMQLDKGNIFVDVPKESLYGAVLQFAQTVAKVANMRLYRREVIQSLFYEQLASFIESNLRAFNPTEHALPIPERDDLEVDFRFDVEPHPIFLFGVKDVAKARLATISMLEFQKQRLLFKGFVVHEDVESLPRKDRTRIMSAADKQFPSLDDFRQNAERVFGLEAA